MTYPLVLFAVAAISLEAQEWSRFRGPNGSGVATGGSLPIEFGPERHLVWKTALPPGHSSPVLSADRVFVTAVDQDRLLTIALDRASGRIVWQVEAPRAREQRVDARNSPASSTPVVDENDVYVFFQDFGLLSYDASGRERWRLPLGPFNNIYGMGASPIIVGDVLVLVCDQSTGSFMLAVGKEDGRVRWKVDRPDATSGHSTPVVFEPPGGGRQLLVPGSFFLTAYELKSGAPIWWTDGLAFEMKATPVHDGSVVYISGTSTSSFQDSYDGNIPSFRELRSADRDTDGRFSRQEIPDALATRWMRLLDLDGDDTLDEAEWERFRKARRNAGGMWAFRMGGSGNMTEKSALWHYEKAVPQLPSPLLYRAVLYMVNDGGVVTAFDPGTGRILAQRRVRAAVDSYYASPVAGDGKLYIVSGSGKVLVLAADRALTLLAVNDLDEISYATPAIAAGRIYIRTQSALYCFGVR